MAAVCHRAPRRRAGTRRAWSPGPPAGSSRLGGRRRRTRWLRSATAATGKARGMRGAHHVHRGVPGTAAMTQARAARPDAEVVFDPSTYVGGVPFGALARLRGEAPGVWVAEIPVLGWPAGPGFWLVLRHADVESVLTRPQLSSS